MFGRPNPRPQIPASMHAGEPIGVPLDSLERHLQLIAAQTADPRAGIFGPASISWKIHRESALFLAAGRAALLQLAHPWVATAIHQHSNVLNDPVARFHNTFRVVFTMFFGTLDQALASSRYLYRLHTGIQGEIPETVAAYSQGSRYQANEVNALLWVYATLIESAVLAYESILRPLTTEEREHYYVEIKTFAALFGIPHEALPADWAAFELYNREMHASNALGVNALSRELARGVLHGSGSRIPVPHWYRALTASWMPERLRAEFALDFGESERASATRALEWLPSIYRGFPPALRFVGPYQEAQARVHGRKAGPLLRANNRFWMGQPYTMFAELES
jgi:uncharacterized protein (DUF2236 family)